MPKSAERVMRILEYCRSSEDGLRNIEIAEALKIPTSSLSILLHTMVKNGYLLFNPNEKKYKIGPQVLILASHYLANLDIVELGNPVLKRIVAITNESASLGINKGKEVVYISKIDSSQPLSRVITIGSSAPLYASASGKIFLAHLSEDMLDYYFSTEEMKPFTRRTITDRKILIRELEKIKTAGIAKNREELNENIVAWAAPVFDMKGSVAATMNVAMPIFRATKKKEAEVTKVLREAAQELSYKIGYTATSD